MIGPPLGARRRRRIVAGVVALLAATPGAGAAADEVSGALVLPSPWADRGASFAPEAMPEAPASPASKGDWSAPTRKSYLLPALESGAFLWLLNRYDRAAYGTDIYGTTWDSGWQHVLHGPWEFDTDPFRMNMILHPYLGAINHGFARSANLNYWESLGYTLASSFVWETYGETGPPSINDQIMTGVGGSFLGEVLFRMASLLLEGNGARPGFWREVGAAGLSPSTGLNRLAFGRRFKAVWVSKDPATFTRLRLGASLTSRQTDQGVGRTVDRPEATGDFSLSYGLPGKPGYGYERPFDYFHVEFTAVANRDNSFENFTTRGLVYGTDYSAGEAYRGVWGIYGSYDFISPEVFRVSSTALSVGTTAQWWLSSGMALQGSALAGGGFGAAGTISAVGSPTLGERDYHFGGALQGLLALRLILGDRAMLDLTAREYYVSGVASDNTHGSERIFRGNASCTVRVYGQHGIGIQYVESRRNASYAELPDRSQTVGTFSVAYNYLGDSKFGSVEWRDADRG